MPQLTINPPLGSSILDVCLNAYLSLNLLGKFVADNNIRSLDFVTGVGDSFIFDSDFIDDEFMNSEVVKNNYQFCTGNLKQTNASFSSENYLLIESSEILQSEASEDFVL